MKTRNWYREVCRSYRQNRTNRIKKLDNLYYAISCGMMLFLVIGIVSTFYNRDKILYAITVINLIICVWYEHSGINHERIEAKNKYIEEWLRKSTRGKEK